MGLINYIFAFLGLTVIILLGVALIFRLEKEAALKAELEKVKKSVDEMDEQAKLILRTDLELNKAQEELDKKMTSIYALQEISRAISNTLEEDKIFKSIDSYHLKDLGFEKALAFLWDEKDKKFALHLNIGYMDNELEKILTFVETNKDSYLELIHNEHVNSLRSMPVGIEKKEALNRLFKITFYIICPIMPKEGKKGFLFVGTEKENVSITEGDEESITILANQIGQSLENARLFEKSWKAQQELGRRVEERTQELSRALEELNIINKRESDFVSSVSHELRTPLTSVKGYAALLLSGKFGELPEEARKRIEKLNRHTDELVQFINDLLDISRLESGKVTMQPAECDLKKMSEEILDMFVILMKEKQLEISFKIDDDARLLQADNNQIKRVFINIINNALKFTPPGGKISVESHKTPEGIKVDISDTGYGIPEEALEKIFQEFYRVDNNINQQIKGTGLGLTLVKNIIEAHKGKIWVKSKVGAGSTFSFILPQNI